jgi:hypothetical protein
MERDLDDVVAEWYREQSDRPLGDAQLASGRTLAPFSRALSVGAENLLVKAIAAMRAGDEEEAAALVRRAVRLPFDDHEKVAPAAMAAHHLLFEVVTDTLEASADGDMQWLEAAVAVREGPDEFARLDMRDVLSAVAQDNDLTTRERRLLQAGVRKVPPAPELIDFVDIDPTELAQRVQAILRACRTYSDAL